MTEPTAKKRGRPRKQISAEAKTKKRGRPRKPVVVVHLAQVQPEWEARLRRAGNPKELSSEFEVSEESMPSTNREPSGRKVHPRKVVYGESYEHRSITQQTDRALSQLQDSAANESIALSADWQRYLEYMGVVAEELSPKDKGAELKKLALQDARSRHNAQPPEFPAELGTPAEFKRRLADNEMEIRKKFNRREHIINICVYPLPPDEEEDVDETEDSQGHWEGLKWVWDCAE